MERRKMMSSDYIVNGKVVRNRIALDIKYGKLDRSAIERLISDPNIASAFIGSSFNKKKPKKEWNKSYLDELSYAAIAESFNRDYLLYLNEVANFVSNAKFKKVIIKLIIIALVITAGIVVHKVMSAKPASPDKPEIELEIETTVSVILNLSEAITMNYTKLTKFLEDGSA